ncbi:hypothetical protein UFOVP513_51 [uncultured Caudovirales phage]|uniref:Uncharacterized protein n=1 Tax=uncultured Caudovirales phage TaxID=2100421 RepID=A0A6J5MS40_9CAUD|nr:hypothetical protein UFOVP513_51 [uncultured Caudovirales phage]
MSRVKESESLLAQEVEELKYQISMLEDRPVTVVNVDKIVFWAFIVILAIGLGFVL